MDDDVVMVTRIVHIPAEDTGERPVEKPNFTAVFPEPLDLPDALARLAEIPEGDHAYVGCFRLIAGTSLRHTGTFALDAPVTLDDLVAAAENATLVAPAPHQATTRELARLAGAATHNFGLENDANERGVIVRPNDFRVDVVDLIEELTELLARFDAETGGVYAP